MTLSLHKILTFLHVGFATPGGPPILEMFTIHNNSITIQALMHTMFHVVHGGVGDVVEGQDIDSSNLLLNFMET